MSDTSGHRYGETLPFPSLTFCPGFANSDFTGQCVDCNKTFAGEEKKHHPISNLVVSFSHKLPNRYREKRMVCPN